MKTYTITVKHDNGNYKIKTYAHSVEVAVRDIMSAENCPISAIGKIKVEETMYKVVKIFRHSRRRQVIQRYLTENDAKAMVNSFPDSNTHMVVFTKQFAS